MPYAAPKPYDTRFAKVPIDERKDWPPDLAQLRAQEPDLATNQMLIDDYDGEIAFTDAQIGRLIAAMDEAGMLADTLIVLHSDHGEEFWEHGSCDHGHTQYDELLHVPLVLVLPGKIEAGQRIAPRVRTIDVLPTIAHWAGFTPSPGIAGQSLVPVLEKPDGPDRDSISEAILHGTREIKALYQGQEKLIASGAGANQLYDLSPDPNEMRDHAADAPDKVRSMRAVLEAHHAAAKASAEKAAPLELDAASQRRLQGIGYGGVGVAPPKKP
jgi:arylsulfatase A-like enzyme